MNLQAHIRSLLGIQMLVAQKKVSKLTHTVLVM
jgi:hypothetical protein